MMKEKARPQQFASIIIKFYVRQNRGQLSIAALKKISVKTNVDKPKN